MTIFYRRGYMFRGIYTALITPFSNGRVDEKLFAEFVEWQISQGVSGVVPCGTTGESLFLNTEEQQRLIEICVEVAKGRAKVLAGTAGVTTDETIFLTQQAKKAGASGALIVTPWYVKPSQDSLFHHYKAVQDAVDLPIVVYNNPSRTGVEISIELMQRLSELPRIVGIKDASCQAIRTLKLRHALGLKFNLLAGNDDTLAAYLAMGGDGGICVGSNVAPQSFAKFYRAWLDGDLQTFKNRRDELHPLIEAFSCDSNPHPIKYAVSLVKPISLETRLPFQPLPPSACDRIREAVDVFVKQSPHQVLKSKLAV